jgi:hypothetical protein
MNEALERQRAKDPSSPADVLAKLSKSSDKWVREAIARNPSATPQLLMELLEDEEIIVHIAIAANPSATLEILEALMNKVGTETVLEEILENPQCDGILLERLAKLANAYWKSKIAEHHLCPSPLLEFFSHDPYLRPGIARNPAAPTSLLTRLYEEMPDSPFDFYDDLAGNPSMPHEILTELSKSTDGDVRSCVANNRSASIEILRDLAQDKEEDVRRCVAENLSTPVDLLEFLANDSDYWVRAAVARHPAATVEILDMLGKN